MYSLPYALLAIAIFLIARTVFADRSPIPETSGKVHGITDPTELDALLSTNTFVIVDFYADWCSPCRAMAPLFSELASKHSRDGHLAFARVNVEHANAVAERHRVSVLPTFVVLHNGALKDVKFEGLENHRSVHFTDEGLVDRIRGADRAALEAVVRALAHSEEEMADL